MQIALMAITAFDQILGTEGGDMGGHLFLVFQSHEFRHKVV